MKKEDIDVIVPFVIGEDRKWQKDFEGYLATCKKTYSAGQIGHQRFRSLNQIFNCVWSIITYMPWVRKIHLVSCGQKIPNDHELKALTESNNGPKLIYVDHEQIFKDKSHLPSFNSTAINANIINIRDLADKCIYLEDDIIITNPIKATAFFPNNRDWLVSLCFPKILKKHQNDNLETFQSHRNNAIDCLIEKNFKPPFFSLIHCPIPFTKKALSETVKLFSEEISYTSGCHVRDHNGVVVMELLVNYMLAKKIAKISYSHNVIIKDITLDTLTTKEDFDKLLRADVDGFNIIDKPAVLNGSPVLKMLDEFYRNFRSDRFRKRRSINRKFRIVRRLAKKLKRVYQKP